MPELSLHTLEVVAYSKIILATSLLVIVLLAHFRLHRPWLSSILASAVVSGFYLVISWPLQKMWWGNNGDEIFIASFLSQVLFAHPLNDFFYQGLPVFYPPLYFWITGLIAQPFVENAIAAAKIGVAATFFAWFAGMYAWHACANRFSGLRGPQPWFWVFAPAVFLFLLDFNDIILKPYETFPALGVACLVGMIACALPDAKWGWRQYAFFSISGTALFLTYYFWWFVAIPTLVFMALSSSRPVKNSMRILTIGLAIAFGASVYLIPLLFSLTNGMENWQAFYFVPQDLSTFLPFSLITWKTPLLVGGVAGLVLYRNQPFVKANGILLLCCYAYQLGNIIVFALGKHPVQSAKQFLFLGTATLAIGCATLLIELWKKQCEPLSGHGRASVGMLALVCSVPFWPMAHFMDDPVVRGQIEKDLRAPSAALLAPALRTAVPDYQSRIWLSSGIPEINAYLPLHYYLATNPHFSNPAAHYSQRLAVIERIARGSRAESAALMDQVGITALLLYKNKTASTYPLFLWKDTYPNGGTEHQIDIPKVTIGALGWNTAYENAEWIIIVKPVQR